MVLVRLQREVAARKAAESAAEEKVRELAQAARAHERLLGGGVKLMTDILATARPEVFQKAAKVQRWARRLSKHIKVEKGWELDLAALLYPLGVISLPDELAAKYAADLPLGETDALRIEESALVASRLIANMPRMEGVAKTVFYAHRGFDGSGWPKDGPSGAELPQAARILKVLIDLADAATGTSRTRAGAFQKLSLNQQRYDPDIFAAAYDVLLVPVYELLEGQIMVSPILARPGDVLVHDLTDEHGLLLLSAGTKLTELSAHRLLSLAQTTKLPDEIAVAREDKEADATAELPDEELF
jgi:HD-GYP domain-containing protein (c-di-GMP phosphodiesterase class II)